MNAASHYVVLEVERDRDGHAVPLRYVTAPTDHLNATHVAEVLGPRYRVYECKPITETENQE